eukprot:jgi/Orpsp1_1/1191890/evm.model.d7180000089183.1
MVVIFNYYISTSFAENDFYIIGIKRDDNDDDYDNSSKQVRESIDKLVNDRMNDIYDIIENNKDTFILDNGEIDEKLNELENSKLKKRDVKKTIRYNFINKNRRINTRFYKRSLNSTIDYIPKESDIVAHICPVKNYYTIKAYLSDSIIEDVIKLPNVVSCEKINISSREDFSDSDKTFYYNLNYIQKETNWTGVSVQEHDTYSGKNFFTHLSLISQSKYHRKFTEVYDNNFYYPSSAGKGIDIYLIDEGLIFKDENNILFDDYDQYLGTPDERIIKCDAIIKNGVIKSIPELSNDCRIKPGNIPYHGNMVSSMVGGKIFGVSKKANIHMLATDFTDLDELAALDYISQNSKPHKTIINISRGSWFGYKKVMEDKINELVDNGYIIFVSAGNTSSYCCGQEKGTYNFKAYSGYKNVIAVGALQNTLYNSMYYAYEPSNYSNYGECVFIHAPGEVIYPPVYNSQVYNGFKYSSVHGTSCASPIVAGVAASIMSEHPEIEFNSELIKKYLDELSVKDFLQNLTHNSTTLLTPNRLLNNGKHTVFSPVNSYNGCGELVGGSKCINGCCSKESQCINPINNPSQLCDIKNGCQSKFGICSTNEQFIVPLDDNSSSNNDTELIKEQDTINRIGQKCGTEYGSCIVMNETGGIIVH